VSRAPTHAGSLRLTERFAFVMVFTVMAAFVVGLTVLADKSGVRSELEGSVSDGSRAMTAGDGSVTSAGSGKHAAAGAKAGTRSAQQPTALNARLTAALRAALGNKASRLSVGVADTVTGAEALYQPGKRSYAGGITRADILAALLYQHQQARMPIGRKDAAMAAKMIDNGDRAVAAKLWQAIGRGAGLRAANQALGLRHTVPGVADKWALTRTTVADQLRLLTDLAGAHSRLRSPGRAYELGLMGRSAVARRWGVAAAASTSYAVTDPRQAHSRRFLINSLTVIHHAGHVLLVVVLSRNWRTQAAGFAAVRAAVAAIRAMPASP